MTNQINQRFVAITNNDLGVYSVFDLYNEKSTISVIVEDERKGQTISYIIYEANDMNAAVRHAENIYQNYHHVKGILALS